MMKTKPLTFLLALTFLFLFCGSVFGQESDVKKEYWNNGKLKSESHYKDGKLDGRKTEWHEDGEVKSVGYYDNGELVEHRDYSKDVSDGVQRCGNYLIQVKEDLSDKRFKFLYLVLTDDKGNKFNSETGVRISEVKCLDLTGDKNPDLFVELWQGGQRAASFDSYVYLLENPIKLVFQNHYRSEGLYDLNKDGIQEIATWYPFRYFGGLCGACSPSVTRNFCYQNGKYEDCSSQFPDYVKSNLNKSKKQLEDGIKTTIDPTINIEDQMLDGFVMLKAHAVEILANAMLLNEEEQAMNYLSRTLPKIDYSWVDDRRAEVRGILGSTSLEGVRKEVNSFLGIVKGHMNKNKNGLDEEEK